MIGGGRSTLSCMKMTRGVSATRLLPPEHVGTGWRSSFGLRRSASRVLRCRPRRERTCSNEGLRGCIAVNRHSCNVVGSKRRCNERRYAERYIVSVREILPGTCTMDGRRAREVDVFSVFAIDSRDREAYRSRRSSWPFASVEGAREWKRGLLHTQRRNGARSDRRSSHDPSSESHCSGSRLREVLDRPAITPLIVALASRSSRLSLRSTRSRGLRP